MNVLCTPRVCLYLLLQPRAFKTDIRAGCLTPHFCSELPSVSITVLVPLPTIYSQYTDSFSSHHYTTNILRPLLPSSSARASKASPRHRGEAAFALRLTGTYIPCGHTQFIASESRAGYHSQRIPDSFAQLYRKLKLASLGCPSNRPSTSHCQLAAEYTFQFLDHTYSADTASEPDHFFPRYRHRNHRKR